MSEAVSHMAGENPLLDVRQREALEGMCELEFPYPSQRFEGRGIVICGGGAKYFPCAYVLVLLLRHLQCLLPIEVWHLGAREMTGNEGQGTRDGLIICSSWIGK